MRTEGQEGIEGTVGINIKWPAGLGGGGKWLAGGKECKGKRELKVQQLTRCVHEVKEVL